MTAQPNAVTLTLPHSLYLRVIAALNIAEAHAEAEYRQMIEAGSDEHTLNAYCIRLNEIRSAILSADQALDASAVLGRAA